jgi:hypothetical protein
LQRKTGPIRKKLKIELLSVAAACSLLAAGILSEQVTSSQLPEARSK